MKKSILFALAICLFASSAMAYDFGSIKVDPNVGMQKEVTSPWYGNKKPIFFGDKPEVAMAWNKKDSTHGILQIGFDVSGSQVLYLGSKSEMGASLAGTDLSDNGRALIVSGGDNKDIGVFANDTMAGLSTEGLPLEIDSSGLLRITSDDTMTIVAPHVNMRIINQFELATVTPGSCNKYQIGIMNNGPAGIDLCYCREINTWACAAMTDVVVP